MRRYGATKHNTDTRLEDYLEVIVIKKTNCLFKHNSFEISGMIS